MNEISPDNRPKHEFWTPGNWVRECLVCKELYLGGNLSICCADCAYRTKEKK